MTAPAIHSSNPGNVNASATLNASPQLVTITVTNSDKNSYKAPPQVFTASRVKDTQQGFTEPVSINGKTFYFKDNAQTTNLKIAYLLDKDHHQLRAKVSPFVNPTTSNNSPQAAQPRFVKGTPQSNLTHTLSGNPGKPVVQPQPRPNVIYGNDGTHGIPYHGPLGLPASKGRGIDILPNVVDTDIKRFNPHVPSFRFSRVHTAHAPSMRMDPKYVTQQQQQQQQAQARLHPDQPLALKPTRGGDTRSV